MIRLRKIEIHINQEFDTERELTKFKTDIATYVAEHLDQPPTIYNSFETHENKLIINQ